MLVVLQQQSFSKEQNKKKIIAQKSSKFSRDFVRSLKKKQKNKTKKTRSSRRNPQIFREVSHVLQKKKRKFKLILVWLFFLSANQKIVLSSSRGQEVFEDLKASRPRTWSLRPRTSKRVLEAKDVLEDATFDVDSGALA